MIGNYVEVGIDSVGGFEGTDTILSPLPFGTHFRSGRPYFGFVANAQMDSWTNFDGDFYTPGAPENGWGITIWNNPDYFDLNNNRADTSDIPGAIISYTYSLGIHTVNWEGSYIGSGYDLDFLIEYTLNDTLLYYDTKVTITNNGPGTIDYLYFFKTMDPDNNESINSDFSTTNKILSQRAYTGVSAVEVTQYTPWLSSVSFLSTDTLCWATYGGFTNRRAADVWNGVGFTQTAGSSMYSDIAISIAFQAKNLLDTATASTHAPGSASVTFSYKTVFSQTVLNELIATTGLNDLHTEDAFFVYPNPSNTNVNILSRENINEITVYNASGTNVETISNVNNKNYTLDISNYNNGIYMLRIKTGETTVVRKVVKN